MSDTVEGTVLTAAYVRSNVFIYGMWNNNHNNNSESISQ